MRSVARPLVLLALLSPAPAHAAEDGPVIVLEVLSRVGPEEEPEAAPPRFTLFEDGQVYVGGSRELLAGRLEKAEIKGIESQLDRIRKLPGLGTTVVFGPGPGRARLRVHKGRPLEIVATGDPAAAPPGLRAVAALVQSLGSFTHPSLRPFRPSAHLARAREGRLAGGCRAWDERLPPLAELVSQPRSVASELLSGWPTGAIPASVCAGGKTWVVTFRPSIPGERP